MTSSVDWFRRAQDVLPGGVNSPVRACRGVGCDPLFIGSARGSRMRTVDGQELIDFVLSWGPMILGHCDPEVIEAARAAVERGSSYGAPCPGEVELAEAVRRLMPGMEMMRMVSSGTEATMSALRLARGFTGRDKLIKFDGCYHGHSDAFLASAGSGLATLSIPGTPGVPADVVAHTLIAPYNDLEAVEDLFNRHGREIACVIVEPAAGNMGLVPPEPGFLEGLRALCTRFGALLIFDEVITGFRLSLGGAQARYGVRPDLTTLGKIIGGGFPVGCFGGRREIMEHVAPVGAVYQAGTLSGNPAAMAAGLATLRRLEACDYDALERRTLAFARDLKSVLEEKGLPVQMNHVASIFTLFFTKTPVTDFDTAKTMDTEAYATFFRQMREAGVNLAPSGYECTFTSFAHTEEDFAATLDAARRVRF
ncbi:MAG TPA: glutamate-1-semialdehyde 2,1-aminomutase [Desulfovibrio sp.]|jgi:glutamate-1-semialdehyde 2,1-aminomutase|uniref:glutamate-1-semialdehyde 2,1-aminomutase n=1 Tax=Desulfovibrio TaxID=872 RepID=UPI002A37809A|nr:glutamate-1-semialdehyde 2,1-aminomutase [Desulfovibrio sp.]MDY0306851.1 glutamate-1-semialdehyde 2,1-aminomutase [Desulfovibrionaceae bacterium]HMM37632.1 glutamate-1-semialdehyde 2,1-aminomutase [Desulfovibrio sp.]